MGRFSIVLIVGFAIIAAGLKLNYSRIGSNSQDVSNAQFSENSARNLARSAAEMSISELSQDKTWRAGYYLTIGESEVEVDIVDSSEDPSLGLDTIRIEIEAESYDEEVYSEVMVAVNSLDFPVNLVAGVTAQCDIQTLGTLTVDGRDHDMQGNVLPDDGVYAIRTMGNFTRMGSSELGGTKDDGIDLEPTRWNGWQQVVEEYMTWPGTYPTEPDQVIGVPLGTLKGLAQGGVNGGQYVVDPNNLTFPLNGVTWVELPSGTEWTPSFFTQPSSGILVVHNDDGNAVMNNVTGDSFTGLIITDDMVRVHNTIIGGVFLLTVGPTYGNCIGNGTGYILFSKEAIFAGLNNGGLKGDSLWVMSYFE